MGKLVIRASGDACKVKRCKCAKVQRGNEVEQAYELLDGKRRSKNKNPFTHPIGKDEV